MLWGEAGTGKSHTLTATRAAYEASGRDVIGLSWTNDVVQQMHGDGLKIAAPSPARFTPTTKAGQAGMTTPS